MTEKALNPSVLVALYRDLPRVRCETCEAPAVPEGSTCPKSIECPECHARPGSRCKRPSGHEASETHRRRWIAAERKDLETLGDCPCGAGDCVAFVRRLRVAGLDPGNHLRPCKVPRYRTAAING